MKFSIITVCKNSEKTIEGAINSVLNQTCQDFEHIIVDGVSADKTLDVVGKYNINKVISEPDSGLYDAMNKGIKASSGDYLFFLNSDDRFLNDKIFESVAKQAGKELLYGDQVFINRETGETSIRKHNKLNKIYLMKNTPCQPATFYRRDVFEKYGYFNTNFKIVSDHEWFLRAFLKHKISSTYLGFPVTEFTMGGLSSCKAREERKNEEINTMFDMYFSPFQRKKLEFISKYLRCFSSIFGCNI